MNSTQENNQITQNPASVNSTFARMKQSNSGALQTLKETPYQPQVYAIPKEHWNAALTCMEQLTAFHNEIYERMDTLPTREEVIEQNAETWEAVNHWARETTDQMMEEASEIVPRVQSALTETRSLIAQDGKTRDEYMKQIEALNEEHRNDLSEFFAMMKIRMLWFLIGTAGGSALLTTLICLLLR